MEIKARIEHLINILISNIHERRKVILSLSCIVVFVTTYMLILPAFTLDKEEAAEQGGIDVPVSEQSIDADTTREKDPVEEAPTEGVTAEETAVEETVAEETEDIEENEMPVEESTSVEEEEIPSDVTLQNDDNDDFTVAVEGKDAGLTEDMSVKVREIDQSSKKLKKEYNALYNDALDAVQNVEATDTRSDFAFAKFYDISLMDGEDEIEPGAAVDVKISFGKDLQKELKVADTDRVYIVHFAVDEETGEVIPEVLDPESTDVTVKNNKVTEAAFTTDSFSVFAVVYTVDFHYEVNGKQYSFNMAGGGYIRLAQLIDMLKISDMGTQDFLADVVSVEFSDPELVWAGKAESDTTVGDLKQANGLELEYSANLTKDQITEIDAQTVEAGDWALISLKPFSSEETLTVTMKNGDQFEVKVTDDQEITTFQQLKNNGTTTVVIWTYNPSTGKYYALKNDGTTKILNSRDEIDTLPREFLWDYTYKWNQDFWVQSVADRSKFLYMCNENELIAGGACNIATTEAGNGAFYLKGYNERYLWLDGSNNFHEHQNSGTPIHLSEQKTLNTYNYSVRSDNTDMGTVNISSGTTNSAFQNTVVITATPNSTPVDNHGHTKYIFDYWDLNGTRRNDLPQSIGVGGVTFPWTNSTLTAHFKRNPEYVEQDDDQKEGREFSEEEKSQLNGWLDELKGRAVPFNINSTKKTAELYDYENRIYQVDLTAESSLETFDGVIDLGFILDMSGSMQFPADLKEATVVGSNETTDAWYVRKNVRTSDNTDLRQYGWTENYWGGIEVSNSDGQVLIGRLNDNDTTKQILNRNKTYYYVADRAGTFTVYHMKYDWSQDSGHGAWVSSDASWNSYGPMSRQNYYKSNDPRGLYYTLYEASQNGSYTKNATTLDNKDRNRKWYLEHSLNSTIGECNDILKKISIAKGDTNNKNPDVEIAYNTFFWKVDQKSYNFVSTTGITDDLSYDTDGGTGTDLALLSATGEKYSNEAFNGGSGDKTHYTQQSYTASGDNPAGFQWKTNDNRYVILITDGAPQANSKAIHSQYVIDAANKLKNEDNVTLITVGLSMKDVRRGSVLLYDIASRDETGEPLFFAAEGDDLQYVLYSIIRSIIQKAIVEGDITDTVDEAFYPIDITSGAPLTNGQVINLSGEKIANSVSSMTDEQKAAGYGVVTVENGKYTITWSSQEIGWEPWHGTFYQKAKEHFLGGNTVRTNDPENPATVEATGYKFKPGDPAIAITDNPQILSEEDRKRTMESPRVNVNELNFTMNDTEWTVYTGQDIDPLDELKRLYSKIDVEMVVQKDKNDQVDGHKDNYSFPLMYDTSDTRTPIGVRDTFPLEQVLPLTDADWAKLINGEEVVKTYDAYGQDCPSTYKVTLTKDHDPNSHSAETTEHYTLEAVLYPLHDHLPAGLGGTDPWEYHTGTYHSFDPGLTAGNDDSLNHHTVNVFVKGLQITKKDQTFTDKLKGAVFKLYRTARAGETENLKEINGKQFFPVATLDMTSNSVATINRVDALKEGEEYYLVETKAPAGCVMLTDPIPVNLDISNTYTPKPGDTTVSAKPETDPYSWTQTATLTVGPSEWVHRTNQAGENLTGTALNATSETETMYYDIANDVGASLPNTGGSGTTLIYILGIMLTGVAGAGLVVRKRKRKKTA